MARQEVLFKGDPPIRWILLWELVLEVPAGGAAVMRAQLAQLLIESESMDIAIRVVPKNVGAHPGLDGAFKIMTTVTGVVVFVVSSGGVVSFLLLKKCESMS